MFERLDALSTDLFVAGEFTPAANGRRFSVIDPATETVIAEVADASPADGKRALDAAAVAQPRWAAVAPRQRAEVLRRAFDLMVEHAEQLACVMVAENGKALKDARAEVAYAAEFFRWFSEEAVRNVGDLSIAPSGQNRIIVEHQPIGIALLVTPWNFPAAMLTRKLAPALAAGCAVVCKPAEDTPLTALALAQLLQEAGVPPGVVNVLPTQHAAVLVDDLLEDGRVRKLSFTGSTEVGRLLLTKAAPQVINCSMELGGNAPFIVLEDADIEAAIAGAVAAKLRNGGEACTAANRFYVAEAVREDFSAGLAAALAAQRVGPGLQEGVDVGPLINEAAINKVERLVEDAVNKGAKTLTGGRRLAGPGFFYPPTVVDAVSPQADILKEEIFGPVAPIVGFSSEDEVIAAANATDFGLVSFVYTKDLGRGLAIAEQLESGMVGINRGVISDPAAPFGGVKQSGLGREGGRIGIDEYREVKYIACSW